MQYAAEAASEGGPVSRVYDSRFRVVYRGRHYASNSLVAHHAKKLGPLALVFDGAFKPVHVGVRRD